MLATAQYNTQKQLIETRILHANKTAQYKQKQSIQTQKAQYLQTYKQPIQTQKAQYLQP